MNNVAAKSKQDTDNVAMESSQRSVFVAYPQRSSSNSEEDTSDQRENSENAVDHENSNAYYDLEDVETDKKNEYENDNGADSKGSGNDHRENDNRENDLNNKETYANDSEEDSNESQENQAQSGENVNENEKDDQTELDPLLHPPPEHNIYENAGPETTHFMLPPVKNDVQGMPHYDPEGISGPTPLPPADATPEGSKTIYIVANKPKNLRPPRNNPPIRYLFGTGSGPEEDYSKGTTVHIPFLFPVNNIIVPPSGSGHYTGASEHQTTVGDFAEPQVASPARPRVVSKPTFIRPPPPPPSPPPRPKSIARPIARPSNIAGARQYAPAGYYPRPYPPQLPQQYAYARPNPNPNPALAHAPPQYAPVPQFHGPPPQPVEAQYAVPPPGYEQGHGGPANYVQPNTYAAPPNAYAAQHSNFVGGPGPYHAPIAPNYPGPEPIGYAAVPAAPNRYPAPPANYHTIQNGPPVAPDYVHQNAYPPPNSYHPASTYAGPSPQPPANYPTAPQENYAAPEQYAATGPQGYDGPHHVAGPQTYVVAPNGNGGENAYDVGHPAYIVQEAPYPGYGPQAAYPGLHGSASSPKAAKLPHKVGKVGSIANATKTIKYVTKPEYAKKMQQKKAGKYSGNR